MLKNEIFEIMINTRKKVKKAWSILLGLSIYILLVSPAHATWVPLTDAYSISSMPIGGLEVDKILFSDFELTGLAYGGVLEPTADSIFIQGGEDNNTGKLGIRILLNWDTGLNQLINAAINFKVSAAYEHCCIEDAALILKAADITGTGLVGATENIYDADFLGNSLASLSASSQADDFGAFLTDGSDLSLNGVPTPTKEIWIRTGITIQGGTNGSASLYEVSMLYGHIPEPATLLLLCFGSLSLLRIRRRY